MNRRVPLSERFWQKTRQAEDGCILWTGCINSKGYGIISVDGWPTLAHRVAYEMAHGPIPPGQFVHHRCDCRICVNVAHLEVVTHERNMREMVEAGRATRGERNPHAKLTASQVVEIRRRYAAGGVSMAALAREYGVAAPSIHDIVHGYTWAHIPLSATALPAAA